MKNFLILMIAALAFAPTFAQADTKAKKAKKAEVAADSDDDNNSSGGRKQPSDDQPDSDSCGLGWQVTQKKTFAATCTRGTTNAVIPPTFGMTSGTMGCAQHAIAKKDEPALMYVLANYEPLSLEMAQGSGEYIDGLARSLGCNARTYGAFGEMTQKNFKILTNGGKATPVQLFKNVKKQVETSQALSADCV